MTGQLIWGQQQPIVEVKKAEEVKKVGGGQLIVEEKQPEKVKKVGGDLSYEFIDLFNKSKIFAEKQNDKLINHVMSSEQNAHNLILSRMQSGTKFRIITTSKVNYETMKISIPSFRDLYPQQMAQLTPEQ